MIGGRAFAVVALVAFVGGCSEAPSATSSEEQRYTSARETSSDDASETGVSEDEAHDRATDALASQSFEDVADASMCTEDCEGHDAGFEWAKENGYTDAASCSGESTSFVEGCQAYASAFAEKVEEEQSGS